ncbi:MAG: hypothetical protein KDD64_09070, partial [Bdellovibrionales bacterium]|nr:hypothetical protein [Bdellovibrionales bacterium]
SLRFLPIVYLSTHRVIVFAGCANNSFGPASLQLRGEEYPKERLLELKYLKHFSSPLSSVPYGERVLKPHLNNAYSSLPIHL